VIIKQNNAEKYFLEKNFLPRSKNLEMRVEKIPHMVLSNFITPQSLTRRAQP
jgi:hypothetical protein